MEAFAVLQQFAKTLRQLDKWIEMAAAHAQAKPFDAEILFSSRLAPDQFALVRQVQSSCDTAKFAAAYLTGTTPPSHPDNEQKLADLRGRIATCLGYLETIKAEDLAGAETRKVAPPRLQGKWYTGADYLLQHAVPNFYFHATTAYAILRHNGVPLGKRDFLGPMPIREAE